MFNTIQTLLYLAPNTNLFRSTVFSVFIPVRSVSLFGCTSVYLYIPLCLPALPLVSAMVRSIQDFPVTDSKFVTQSGRPQKCIFSTKIVTVSCWPIPRPIYGEGYISSQKSHHASNFYLRDRKKKKKRLKC